MPVIETDHIDVTMQSKLRDLVAHAADSANVAMTAYVRDVLANHFGKPHLARMPRMRAGRPRKDERGNGDR